MSILLAVLLAGALRAEPVVLGPQDLRRTGEIALQSGKPGAALAIANALLGRDPLDWNALLLKSRAARDLGDYATARAAARAAWRSAQTPAQRYAAALARAQADASDNRRTAAQFWLRRAIQVAPDDRARQLATRDFRYVRARNPWQFSVNAGLAPSSNINGGSSSDVLMLGAIPLELSPDAKALSGLEGRLTLTAGRRIWETARSVTELGARLSGRAYRLSDSARAKAPMAQASDYAYGELETYALHKRRTSDGGEVETRLTLGRNWYGGSPLSNYVQADLSRSFTLSNRSVVQLRGGVERQWRLDQSARSANVVSTGFGYQKAFATGRLSLDLDWRRVLSDSISIDHSAAGVTLGYGFGKPVLGAEVTAYLSLDLSDFGASPYAVGGRQDRRSEAGVSLFFRDFDYLGFAPELGLRASRTESNISLYDSHDLGLTLGFRSAF